MLQVKATSEGDMLSHRTSSILDRCASIVILNDDDYAEADRLLSETKSLDNAVVLYWGAGKASAYTTWKIVVSKEKEMRDRIETSKDRISAVMVAYKSEYDKAAQKKRGEEQEQSKRDTQLQAFELAEQGAPIEAVNAVMQLAEEPVSLAPVAELRGKTSFVIDYDVSVIPGQEHLIPVEFLLPTTPQLVKALESKIKKIAKATGGQKIAGIEITQTQSCRRRSN